MSSARLQHILQMLKDDPNDSFLNYALAIEYANAGDVAKAIQLIETLLQKDSDYLGAYYQLGKYYEQTNQINKALKTYKKGAVIAQQQKNRKTLGELNQAIFHIEDSE